MPFEPKATPVFQKKKEKKVGKRAERLDQREEG
jgi:hypothetical protein